MGPPEISLTKRLTSDVIGALSDERKTVWREEVLNGVDWRQLFGHVGAAVVELLEDDDSLVRIDVELLEDGLLAGGGKLQESKVSF